MKNVLQMRKDNIMKQYIKYICLFLILGMSTEMWGSKTGTIYFGNSGTKINAASVSGDDDLGNTWTITTVGTTSYTQNNGYAQVGSSDKPATSITFTMTLPASKSITAFSAKFGGFSSTAGTVTLKVGDTSVGTGSLSGGSDVTISNSSTASGTVLQVTVTSIAKGVKCYYVSYTYSNSEAYYVLYDPQGGTCAKEDDEEASANAGVELPDVTPSSGAASMGWGFYGWAEEAVDAPTTTAPTIVGKAGDTYYPEEEIMLYAVFAKGEYTKVTSTSEITVGSGEKYLIMGYDHIDSDNGFGMYAMTHRSFIDNYDNEYMYGYRLGDAPLDTYSAAAVNADWRYEITKSTTYYYFQNIATSKYVDTELAANRIYTGTKTAAHKYIITYSSNGYCTIKNDASTHSYPYLNVFDGDGAFSNGSSGWERMMIYKETETPTYCSKPATVKLVASPAAGGTVVFDSNSKAEMDFSTNDGLDDVGITATPNSEYEFVNWVSSDNAAASVDDDDDDDATTNVTAIESATITANFYKMSSVTLTLTGLTRTSGPNGSNAITSSVDAADIVWTFSLNDHYRSTPLTCSVTMGGSTLTEGAGNDYTWNASTKTLTIPAATDITGDLVITISAEHTEFTKYAFSCSELTLTPKLVTDGAPIFITSAASKMVRSQDSILIVGNGLTPNADLTFPSLAGTKFSVKSRVGGDFTIKADGTIDTVAYIFYTPDAGDTSDGLDKLTGITVSVGGAKPKTATLTQDIIGRHLPSDFVIAAKKDGKWWVMPSNMASTTNPTPVEISVDNATNPSIAYTLSNTYYGLAGPTPTNISDGNGQYIRFAMSIDDGTLDPHAAPLFGIATGKTTLGKSGTSQISSDLSAGYWWKLVQTNTSITNPQDAKYTIYCANNTQSLTLEDGGLWGLYATNGTDVDELRLVPARSGVSYEEAEIVEWGQHGAIVEVDTHLGYHTKVKAKLNGAETGFITLSQTKTSVSEVDTKYNYTVNFGDGIDFAAAASNGAMLTLEWYNTSEVLQSVSNITVPKIIASSATMSTIESRKTQWQTWEVHVLPGVTLEANAGLFSSSNVTIKDLQIYPGATVKVTSGTLDVTNLSLRNGWTRVGAKKYDVARLQIKADANLTHTNAYLDWYIDNDQYYPVAVPFPVTVSAITYLNTKNSVTIGGTSGVIRLRYFDGANRAAGKSGNWKYYGEPGSLAVPAQLLPSMGYAMAAKRPGGKAFSIVRMPMTFTNEWTALGEQGSATVDEVPLRKDTVHVFAYGNEKTAEWNKGWNLIGNPYMAVFHGDNDEDGIYGKILAVSKVNEEEGDKLRYVTIPNSSFTDYAQVQYKDTLLKPSSSFLIQAKDTCRLEFSSAKIDVPSAPARYTATPAEALEHEAYIRLSYEGGSDQMGLVIGEDYTAAYETNADLAKMLGELNTLKTYMMYDDVEMAYLAINEDLAREWIPVTVRIPETGEYTYSLTGSSEIENLEGVYLIDYETNIVTNLIGNNYSFVATEGTIDDRFAINAIVGRHETPTDIDIINAGGDINSDKPVKFIFNDKVFILHNGVIYDASGKKVREINR